MRANHRLYTLASLFCLLLATSLSHAAEDGWVTLIDGTEGMDNFDIVGNANWSGEFNAVQATEGSGASFLVSKQSYSDFTLRVEFWASPDANSGIFLRCQDPSTINDRNCYEANIFDQRPDPSFGTGGIVHIAPVAEPRPTAGNKWSVYVITLEGDHLLVQLNGKTTVDVQDQLFSDGPFALQWGRGALRFRKVVIKEL
ncbi:MAG: DUF1080 domain-containing protein [Gammaproteobacteria bacterium]|jgi:hypothetical protein|nr:DUF1080 domain-containing protein [Gammaproteobacteria bacterium]MBT3859366.1 DUF1080 domain-containing protein [Gammaproteobacteria bacterium]MBT3986891.1 DUF1080 domain-containing protein [Gammaproteobacteria bacterium]MBT4254473.1 DUF1080 domain-containing protein [Gammaproteobacteria bacterium]MBT4583421.1 DUF1080 domain-containing protein [Gammaproteobacteria bacterium]